MAKYFSYFPTTDYLGYQITDITKRVKFMDYISGNPYLFLPYTIEDDDRAEDVAYYYYDSVDYTWLVYLANNIVDPYTQWPLTQDNFYKHMIKKYSSVSGLSGYPVISWTQNTLITDNILHYKNNDDPTKLISKDTYTLDSELIGGEWTAVRFYEHELELNDNKRTIQLANKNYAKKMLQELKDLVNT